MSICKITYLKFCRLFRQSVTKIMGKTVFLCFSPVHAVYNAEQKWGKLAPAMLSVRNIV